MRILILLFLSFLVVGCERDQNKELEYYMAIIVENKCKSEGKKPILFRNKNDITKFKVLCVEYDENEIRY